MGRPLDLPVNWELERQVIDVVRHSIGEHRARISLDDRLVQDLGIESLDMIELVMAIEQAFNVEMSDDIAKELFTNQPATVRTLVQFIEMQWGTGAPPRKNCTDPRPLLSAAESVPFTQLGYEAERWLRGPLFEPIGRNREGYEQFLRATDGMRCVLVPAGKAVIGSDSNQDESPAHPVRLSEFLIDAEPVSNAAFARFLNEAKASAERAAEWIGVPPEDDRIDFVPIRRKLGRWRPLDGVEQQPVVLASWFGARAYSLWANGADVSSDSCLPTEAQWEYAARGDAATGTQTPEQQPLVARHQAGASYSPNDLPAADVNERRGMSPFGVHHMGGNVWNWCRDWYDPRYYRSPESRTVDAWNSRPTGIRSERGGSWVGPECLASPSYRRGRLPEARGRCLGFRCVSDPRGLTRA